MPKEKFMRPVGHSIFVDLAEISTKAKSRASVRLQTTDAARHSFACFENADIILSTSFPKKSMDPTYLVISRYWSMVNYDAVSKL